MKILLFFLIFSFFFNSASAKNICDGFCIGEDLKVTMAAYPQPSEIIVNGKKKKNPKWMITRAAMLPNSPCIIFDSYLERAIPKKIKKKDQEKYMQEYRDGSSIFGASYAINSCRPCPPGIEPSKTYKKTGYCTITMTALQVWYKTGFEKGYYPPEMADFSQVGLGRDESFDILTDLPNSSNQVVYEFITFPLTFKKDIEFIRFKDKASGNLFYVYSIYTYKTSAKLQVRKQTQHEYVQDQDFVDYLDYYIERIQSTFASVWDKNHEDTKQISKLYELIPNDNELKNFENSFPEIKTFHIQNRQ